MKQRIFGQMLVILLLAAGTLTGQETRSDRFSIPLSDPARPVKLKVHLIDGSISVKAYQGKEVIVETERSGDMEERSDPKKGGLRLIPNTSSGLTIEEDDNEVTVSTGRWGTNAGISLMIQVPVNTSAILKTINDGDIVVDGISGELEVSNINGPVTLTNVAGSVVAHALNDDIVVTLTSVTAGKAMSFSSLNGDIDVTFPSTIKATLDLKSDQGEIYTDFDLAMQKMTPKVVREEKGSKRRVVVDKGMRGTINGGGAEYTFKNFTGDIIIRKGK